MEKDSPAANPAIEEVRQRLDSWRKTKKNHREPIPEDLWQTAADLARAHSVNSVSRALRLSYTDLKEHTYGHTKSGRKKRKTPSFVEIRPGPILSREATLEMENPRGSKIRISFKGGTDFDFTAFAKTFMQKVK
jgi:hypothetical protein